MLVLRERPRRFLRVCSSQRHEDKFPKQWVVLSSRSPADGERIWVNHDAKAPSCHTTRILMHFRNAVCLATYAGPLSYPPHPGDSLPVATAQGPLRTPPPELRGDLNTLVHVCAATTLILRTILFGMNSEPSAWARKEDGVVFRHA